MKHKFNIAEAQEYEHKLQDQLQVQPAIVDEAMELAEILNQPSSHRTKATPYMATH